MNYLPSGIGNADLSDSLSVAEKRASSVSLCTNGIEKMRHTVMFGIRENGSKLSPFVIFKRKTVPKGVKFPAGIHVKFQEKG